MRPMAWIGAAAVALVVLTIVLIAAQRPRHDRDWRPEVARLASVEFGPGSEVTLGNIRAFEWRTREDYDAVWREQVLYLDEVRTVDLLIEPFARTGLLAHAMLSFGFEDGYHLLLSLRRARKKTRSMGSCPACCGSSS